MNYIRFALLVLVVSSHEVYPEVRADDQTPSEQPGELLDHWISVLKADELQNVRFTINVRSWSGVSEVPGSDSDPSHTYSLQCVRRGDSWLTDLQVDLIAEEGRTRKETLLTDQYLSLQGSVTSREIAFEEISQRAIGRLENPAVTRTNALYCVRGRFLFGYLNSEGALSIPEEMKAGMNTGLRKLGSDKVAVEAKSLGSVHLATFSTQTPRLPLEY